ncbi:XRE family transcriptional regulator [Geotalea sp. SG265]|uniref:LexA family protein n=1 Tax=Geotalea sp. SG265 TaxID=2922867 RepID=UPI001FAF74B9|nr:XRE family transcriptional regulator [Geotalea sp. SG265]
MSEKETNHKLGLRIKEIRQSKGMTQKEFADSLGIVQGFLSGVERGKKNISDTLIIALCHTYGINSGWLKTGQGEQFRTSHPKAARSSDVPLFKKIPQDFPQFFVKEDICEYLSLPQGTEGSYAIFSAGDFMAPTICDGDLVIISTESEIENRDIVLVNNRWGEAILRRYRVVGADIFLSPDNRSYAPFKKDSKLKILGKVVDVWRRIKF